ncbi:MAG: hypothetical protein DHS20C17_17740 [Cyclobacteriaceae bacterium]|nr:MAG: hypothetical protein DHS20C17_17740 [Cyclobacteriaceae bacterium]
MKYTNSLYKLLDSKPTILYLAAFVLFGGLRLIMLYWDPIGLPDDHDEFANLLQAETFAQGRLANPAPGLAEHFESFHILVNPTYASKYPPGQSFFLYLGIKLFGHPWYGVLLSCMLMVTCLVWMIRGYCTTGWTVVIGVFIILRFALWNYWASSYWGGAVAAMGGALIFGSIPRFSSGKKGQLLFASLCFGLGLTILSQTRPFEGLLVSIIPGIYLITLVVKNLRKGQTRVAAQMITPMVIVLMFNFSFSAYYNYKITGDPLKLPYQLHGEQYSIQPAFLFLSQRETPPTYNHKMLQRQYQGWELINIKTVKDYLKLKRVHFKKFMRYFYGWPILVVVCLFFINRKGIEVPFWSFILFLLHFPFTSWFHPHYFAPALAVYYLLLIISVKYLIYHRNNLVQRVARIGLPVFLIITLANSKYFATRDLGYINGSQPYVQEKEKIINQLNSIEGKHIVMVKYSDEHKLHEEWVYNGANLDQSKVLWARYISEEKADKLKEYFNDRMVWEIYPDASEIKLLEY